VEKHLDEARHAATRRSEIINTILLDGMKVVGELFGSGKMQLPFVLQSAECMKACVRHLEQFMERVEGSQKGTMVLATVKRRRARHRQEPGRHHPVQQRLQGGQPRDQAAD
jgi:5-methyltetrahydrofolate--homocysteine methyltransferase